MALRAGYYGIKRFLRDELQLIAGTYDGTIKSLFPRSEQAVLGAKNRFPLNLSEIKTRNTSGTWSGNTYTINGITYTIITDGDTVTNISVSGTSTGNADLNLYQSTSYILEQGAFKMTGCPSGGSGSTYCIQFYTNVQTGGLNDEGSGKEFNIGSSEYLTRVVIRIRTGQDFTTAKSFKPMISFATDPDDTYVPYAMTNKELTDSAAEQKISINAIITAATGAADFAAFKTAMGAITPVTRSLSLTKEDLTEEVKEADPKKTVTKKRTTKKTEEE